MHSLPCNLEPLYSLLCCVTDSENAFAVAESLMKTFGSIERIFSSHISEIQREIKGSAEFVNKVAFFLETTKALTRRRKMEVLNIGDLYSECTVVKYLLGLFLFEPMEKVYMLFFDNKTRYIGKELVSSGTVNTSHITIRQALEISLRHNASYVILAHNHPLGNPTPSPEDISTTHNLIAAFGETGVKLLEHYIICGSSFEKVLALANSTLR